MPHEPADREGSRVSEPSGEAPERLPRSMAQAFVRQNRRLERVETKIDRILDVVQKIETRLNDDLDEFEEFDEFDDEPDGSADVNAIRAELEKLSPEELKQQLVQLIATMKAGVVEDDEP